jgi:RNA polymerase sigma-70 factor (ECF subfamily)
VNATPSPDVGHRDEPAAVLGDVLYANNAQPLVPEREWVAFVQSVAAGDQAALHALYVRAHRIVFTLVLRITRDRETAEELTVDVFHDIWRRASSYDPAAGSVVGWIMNQARWRAIDRLRFEQRRKRTVRSQDFVTDSEWSAEDAIVGSGDQVALRNALALLTPEERQAIETAFFSELTHVDTAARLNAPLGTIKTRIRSGLQKLRQALREPEQQP